MAGYLSRGCAAPYRRSPVLCVLLFLALPTSLLAQESRVVVLGFDGIDSDLCEQWMGDGTLPNLKRLREQGGYAPLESVNPAQSPVSWSSFATGTNPGKHGVFGFIRRNNTVKGPLPDIGLAKIVQKDTEDLLGYGPDSKILYAAILGGTLLVLGFGLGKLMRGKFVLPIVLGLLLAAGGVAGVWWFFGQLPSQLPTGEQVRHGDSFWKIAAESGVETIGLQLPMEFPVQDLPNARITAGLGVPDIKGSNGTFYLFTDGQFMIRAREGTPSGGFEVKAIEREDGSFEVEVEGPTNYWIQERIEQLRKLEEDDTLTWKEREKLENERFELSKIEQTSVPMELHPDWENERMRIVLAGREQTLGVGDWSDWFRITFAWNDLIEVQTIARCALTMMDPDQQQFTLFMPPINMSPEEAPVTIAIASPREFSQDLAAQGLYHTIGWACMTNPLKDELIDEETFVQNMGYLFDERARLIRAGFAEKDWRLLIGIFGSTDRMAHMMWRLHEPETEKEKEFADQVSPYMGVPYRDSIKWIYQKMDVFVGEVMDQLPGDATLIILSDHGFSSFRREVNLNTWLALNGYIFPKEGEVTPEADLLKLFPEESVLTTVDWSRTKAYSLGLGKIFINLEGREAKGIVKPEEKRALEEEIAAKLLELKDENGERVVRDVTFADDIYSGPFVAEGSPDLLLGFDDGYCVAWANSLGDFSREVIYDNTSKWSGNHPSNDPKIVTGVLFSNRALGQPTNGHELLNIMDIAPSVLKLLGLQIPAEMDGRPFF